MNDGQLLQSFAGQNSEAAFRALVERHLPLVFGTARRMTSNNALAEDIAQTVFILLSRKASRLGGYPTLSGWLYRTTRFVTSRALTAEQRRRRREQEAIAMQSSHSSDPSWLQSVPQLDDALARLGETDRSAILLRYFEQQSFRDVGLALGLSEEAAQKRVIRAVEKLRRALGRRGAAISAIALATGLTSEAAHAASALPLAGKISAVVLAQSAAGAGAMAGSALLTNVLAAMRWAKILNFSAAVAAAVAVTLLAPPAARYWRRVDLSSDRAQNIPATTPATPFASRLRPDALSSSHTLLVTVRDATTDAVIRGAVLTPYANGVTVPSFQNPLKTGADGTVKLSVPVNLPGAERANYCEIPVNAPGYATRVIRWSCSTGMVLSVVSSEHTVRLSPGVTLSGVVVDDSGRPLPGLRVGALAMGSIGGSGVVEQVDYNSFYLAVETSTVRTDAEGRFKLENYPGDVRSLGLDFQGPDRDLHKFQTPEGFFLHAEVLPKVSLAELKSGAARIVIPRGTTVEGVVVNNNGAPVPGAEVVEATELGNLRILSRNRTDASGRFWLTNRPSHEILLGVTADDCASLSAIVPIHPGMAPVRLQLPPEMPLRGQVVNEAGLPVPSAYIQFEDYFNPGLCLEWGEETGTDGRFEWTSAPTNEVALMVTAPGYAPRVARLRDSTNEAVVTMRLGHNDSVHITGNVIDSESGAPVAQFHVKVFHRTMENTVPEGPSQDFDGGNGQLDVKLLRKDFPVGMGEVWMMAIEAEGYDAAISRSYDLEEGDQPLEFKLKRGGTVEGSVHGPDGAPAAGAQLAFNTNGPLLTTEPGQLQFRMAAGRTSSDGHFNMKKPLVGGNLVVMHESGWTVVPVTAGPQRAEITLSPWGHIEGVVTMGGKPAPNRTIELEPLRQNYFDPLVVFYQATTDSGGNFRFDKTPAGVFKLSCRAGRWNVATLQTCVSLAAGETKTVAMAASGRTVTAQLQPPPDLPGINWSNAVATLSADVEIPSEPAQNDYVEFATWEAARARYAHDPAVLAALARQRTVAGSVGPDGVATFEQVPPGNYILEVKLFDPTRLPPPPNFENDPGVVLSRLRAPVSVPENADTADNAAPAPLGEFALGSF